MYRHMLCYKLQSGKLHDTRGSSSMSPMSAELMAKSQLLKDLAIRDEPYVEQNVLASRAWRGRIEDEPKGKVCPVCNGTAWNPYDHEPCIHS